MTGSGLCFMCVSASVNIHPCTTLPTFLFTYLIVLFDVLVFIMYVFISYYLTIYILYLAIKLLTKRLFN